MLFHTPNTISIQSGRLAQTLCGVKMAVIAYRRNRWVIDYYDENRRRRVKTLKKGTTKDEATAVLNQKLLKLQKARQEAKLKNKLEPIYISDHVKGVYFVQKNDGGPIKIGFSAVSIVMRVKSLQTANSNKLNIIGWIDGDKEIEQKLHRKFSDFNKIGEWFYPSDLLIGFISGINFKKKLQETAHNKLLNLTACK